MGTSALEQIRKLDEDRKKLIDGAKGEAMQKAQDAINELNALGFNYRLAEGDAVARRGRGAPRQKSDTPCPICKFKTSPPHDGRRHRSQGDKKRAFSAQELANLGLSKA